MCVQNVYCFNPYHIPHTDSHSIFFYLFNNFTFPGITIWATTWFVFQDNVLPGQSLFNMSAVVIVGYIFGHTLERYTTVNAVVGMTLIGALYRNLGPPSFLDDEVADLVDYHLRQVRIFCETIFKKLPT